MKKIITLIIILFVFSTASVSAHPGKTDGDGCHTCWTNCEKWGLEYGEYHCHDGESGRRDNGNNGETEENIDRSPAISFTFSIFFAIAAYLLRKHAILCSFASLFSLCLLSLFLSELTGFYAEFIFIFLSIIIWQIFKLIEK